MLTALVCNDIALSRDARPRNRTRFQATSLLGGSYTGGMPDQDPVLNVLSLNKDAVFAAASRMCAKAFSDKAVYETEDHYFRPERFADWTFELASEPESWSQLDASWWAKKDRSYRVPRVGWFKAGWQDQMFVLLRLVVDGAHCPTTRWYVIADSDESANCFFEAVCRYHSTVHGEILVFQEGRWHGDEELFEAIQGASLDDLVLHGDLKEQIRTDIALFLEQGDVYERYKIPWKRGMLLLGPPGNGKTHMIRALTKHFDKPCLYVKSFRAQYSSTQQCVASAFERAREVAPCFLILEDLDTLLTNDTRSFFLNEMDGFASNHGILTIATCNFPDKLDPAITDRPSRFDRKYHFELPELVDRRRYLEQFGTRFDLDLQLSPSGLDRISEVTHGYSFAYLKELYVSSAVRWVSTDSARPIVDVMLDQSETLREQMTTEWAEPPAISSGHDGFRFPVPPGFEDDDDVD